MTVLIIVFLTAIATLFTGTFGQGKLARYVGIAGLLIALGFSFQPEHQFFTQFKTMFDFGVNAALFTRIALIITILIFFLGSFAFISHRSHQSELYALMLFALCGGILLFSFQNLVVLFLGIEILSIPLYVMAGANKTDIRSVEASMKYFLMGAFATGFLLFGIALVYGSALSFDIYELHNFGVENPKNMMFISGAILMLCAMAFKVSLAPFHMWSPDVYQGAPSLITAFMASIVKLAAFYGFFRLMTIVFSGVLPSWINIIGVLVIITMFVANVMGLAQSNAKKMLAYSSVSHAGYLGLVFFGLTNQSVHTLAFYLFAYSLATLGVFISLIYVEKMKRETSFSAFKGLVKAEPLLAVCAAVSVLSMAGIPITAGFVAKFNLFAQAIKTAPFMVLVAVLGSAISIAYYLRLIMSMFFFKDDTFEKTETASITYKIVAAFIILLLFALGISPDLFAKGLM